MRDVGFKSHLLERWSEDSFDQAVGRSACSRLIIADGCDDEALFECLLEHLV